MWFCPPDVWDAALWCAVMGGIVRNAGGRFIGFMILNVVCAGFRIRVIMTCLGVIVKPRKCVWAPLKQGGPCLFITNCHPK